MIEKKTKRSEKLTDIRPDIYEITWRDGGQLNMTLATGSSANLKPEVVLEAMKAHLPAFAPTDFDIRRTEICDEEGKTLI